MYNGLSFGVGGAAGMNICVWDSLYGEEDNTAVRLADLAGEPFSIAERVPGADGTAFDLYGWYEGWLKNKNAQSGAQPTYMRVEAADGFEAVIPWKQLGQAAFVFEQQGQPLAKGFPLRLYVPDGSSACLNVKSVVRIELRYDGLGSDQATYGFKNRISASDLRKI
jgi:hypothetical protein